MTKIATLLGAAALTVVSVAVIALAMGTPLDAETYVSLRTFKRDGGAVDTAVWAAPLDGGLVVFTLRDSYKVKRLRRNPRVQVAACGMFGTVTGPWYDGSGKIIDDAAYEARAYEALNEKYGLQMRLGTMMRRLFGGLEKRVILELRLDG